MSEKLQTIADLTKDEVAVYRAVMSKSVATVSTLARALKKKPGQVETIVSGLVEKQLLRPVGEALVRRYVAVPPYGGFLKYLDQFVNQVTEQRERVKGEVTSADFSAINAAVGEDLGADLGASIEEFKTETQGHQQTFHEKIDGAITTAKTGVDESATGLKEDLESQVAKHEKGLTGSQEKFKGKLEKSTNGLAADLDKLLPPLEQQVTALQEKTTTTIQGHQDGLAQNLAAQKAQLQKGVDAILDRTAEILAGLKTQLQESVRERLGEVATGTSTLKETATTHVTAVKENFQAQVNQFDGQVSTLLGQLKGDLQAQLASIKTDTSAKVGDFKQSVDTTYGDLQASLDSRLEQLKAAFSQETEQLVSTHLNAMQAKTQAIRDKVSQTVEQHVETFMDGADQVKDAVGTAVKAEVQNVQTKVKEALAEIQAQYLARIEEQGREFEAAVKNNVNDKVIDMRHELKVMGEGFVQELDGLFNGFETGMQDTRQKFLTQVEDFRASLGQEVSAAFSSGKETLNTLLAEKEGAVTTLADEKSQASGKVVDDGVQAVHSAASGSVADLDAKVSEDITGFATTLDSTEQRVATELQDHVQADVATFDEHYTTLATEVRGNADKVKVAVDAFETQAGHVANENATAVKAGLTEGVQQFKTHAQTFKAAVQEGVGDLLAQVGDLLTTRKSDSTKFLDSVQPRFSKVTTAMHETLGGALSDMEAKTRVFLDKLAGTLEASTAAIKGKVKAKISAAQDTLGQKVGTIGQRLLEVLDAASRAGKTPKDVLAGAWAQIMDTELLDAELTWHLVGEDSAKQYLRDMIERAKSSIFVVTRSYNDLDWKLVLGAQQRAVKFVVACDLGTASPKDLQKAAEAGIDLWAYNGKDLIGIIRDSEEILLAPVSANPADTVALISEADPFIKHLGGMMNDYWRRHARKWTPP